MFQGGVMKCLSLVFILFLLFTFFVDSFAMERKRADFYSRLFEGKSGTVSSSLSGPKIQRTRSLVPKSLPGLYRLPKVFSASFSSKRAQQSCTLKRSVNDWYAIIRKKIDRLASLIGSKHEKILKYRAYQIQLFVGDCREAGLFTNKYKLNRYMPKLEKLYHDIRNSILAERGAFYKKSVQKKHCVSVKIEAQPVVPKKLKTFMKLQVVLKDALTRAKLLKAEGNKVPTVSFRYNSKISQAIRFRETKIRLMSIIAHAQAMLRCEKYDTLAAVKKRLKIAEGMLQEVKDLGQIVKRKGAQIKQERDLVVVYQKKKLRGYSRARRAKSVTFRGT